MENLANLTVSYEDLSSAASSMTEEAGNIKSALKAIDELVNSTLSGNWQGVSWNEYSSNFSKLQPDLEKTANKIAEYGQNLAEIAQKYSDNEQSNEETAANLGTNIF